MPEIDSELELALNYLDHNKDESLKRLFDILKIPSISTQEKYSKDCLNAANWFVEQLQDIGCLLYTSPSPRDGLLSRMPSSA